MAERGDDGGEKVARLAGRGDDGGGLEFRRPDHQARYADAAFFEHALAAFE